MNLPSLLTKSNFGLDTKASVFEDRIARISKKTPLTGAYIEEKFAKAFVQSTEQNAKTSGQFLDNIISVVERCQDPMRALELTAADAAHIGLNYIKVHRELRILKGADVSINNYPPKVIKNIKMVILEFRKALEAMRELEAFIKTKLDQQSYYNRLLANAVAALISIEERYPETVDYMVDIFISKLLIYNPAKIPSNTVNKEISPMVEAEVLSGTIVSACASFDSIKEFMQKVYDVLATEMIAAQQSLDSTIDRFSNINLTNLTHLQQSDTLIQQKYDNALKDIQRISPAVREMGIIK